MALNTIGSQNSANPQLSLDGNQGMGKDLSKDLSSILGTKRLQGNLPKVNSKSFDIANLINDGKRVHQQLGGLMNNVDVTV